MKAEKNTFGRRSFPRHSSRANGNAAIVAHRRIQNRLISLSVDATGRVISLVNRVTGTELITDVKQAEAWRLVIPSGRHTVDFVYGSQQKPDRIEVVREVGCESLVTTYRRLNVGGRFVPIRARFTLSLAGESNEITALVEIENGGTQPIDEVEFPVIGGLGSLPHLVMANDNGYFYPDVLHQGLPNTGNESHHFVRELETAILSANTGYRTGGTSGRWFDLYSDREGLYVACHEQIHRKAGGNLFFKLEKYPKETPHGSGHNYPPETPRWLRTCAIHIPRLAPGKKWCSLPIVVMPHTGDWHAAADRYSAWRHQILPPPATPPSWMKQFVGWTGILGKTYLGEVFHDYRQCADSVIHDQKTTGLDVVFYYGHSKIGAEGADFDQSPSRDLGGEREFRRMIRRLHQRGIRVLLLDHFHRYVNRDTPEYGKLGLDRFAVRGPDGGVGGGRWWWKETALSCLFLEGPTPFWVDICPSCRGWREHYLRHLTRMVDLGVDGLELDVFDPGVCHSADHGHAVGAHMMDAKLDFIREARAHVKKLNPDFVLFGETLCPDARSVLDGFYPVSRFMNEHHHLYRYLFPEITQTAVLVGSYAYDQVNKAIQLGLGVETEVAGLRQTTASACPELARYIGYVTRFRRKHAEILIHGTFRDTLGAKVKGDVFYSVIEGQSGNRALVLRNPHKRVVSGTATLTGVSRKRLVLWQPGCGEKTVRRLPLSFTLKPHTAAVLLALD